MTRLTAMINQNDLKWGWVGGGGKWQNQSIKFCIRLNEITGSWSRSVFGYFAIPRQFSYIQWQRQWKLKESKHIIVSTIIINDSDIQSSADVHRNNTFGFKLERSTSENNRWGLVSDASSRWIESREEDPLFQDHIHGRRKHQLIHDINDRFSTHSLTKV